jgi:hypothetical protein
VRAGTADDLCGMHVTTAPEPERGRAHARLLAHIARLGALDPGRRPAGERLADALGAELARTLVCSLSSDHAKHSACAA